MGIYPWYSEVTFLLCFYSTQTEQKSILYLSTLE